MESLGQNYMRFTFKLIVQNLHYVCMFTFPNHSQSTLDNTGIIKVSNLVEWISAKPYHI